MSADRCHARSSRTGEPCRAYAIVGGTVCVAHGGRAPQVWKAAQRRAAELRLHSLTELLEPVIQTDLENREELTAYSMALLRALVPHVAALEGVSFVGKLGEDVKAEIQAIHRAMTVANQILTDNMRLDLEGRRVRLQEAQVAVVLSAIDRALSDPTAGLTLERRQHLRELVAAALEAPMEVAK